MKTTLGPGQATHVLKKKAEMEIPPPFDLAVPILTDSGSIFAPFSRPVASMWRHFGTPWLVVGLPKGVGIHFGCMWEACVLNVHHLGALGFHLASPSASLGPHLASFWCPLASSWPPRTGHWKRVPILFLFSWFLAPFVAPCCLHVGSKIDAWFNAKSHRFSD